MQGAEGEAVLILVKNRGLGLRTLRNTADAAGSARPEGKMPIFLEKLSEIRLISGKLEILQISQKLGNTSAFI
jgi:hypothetical protein